MRRILGTLLVGTLVAMAGRAQVAQAHAWRRRPPFRTWHGGIALPPPRSITVVVHGSPYYYSRGRYYRPCTGGYVMVPAPVGAVVSELPPASRTVVIDGMVYREYDGVYYKSGPAGYTVVPVAQGEQAIAIAKAESDQPGATVSQEPTVMVNVPNRNGSYTPVTLQLAGNGMYIGPQGEVYPNQPTAEQLAAMYGK